MPMNMPIRAGVIAAVVALAVLAALVVAPAPADAARKAGDSCRGADNWRSSKQARRALLCLVNVERAKRGLPRLRYDRRLSRVAKYHAGDLVRYRFVGHDSPRRGDLLTRIKRSGWARGRSSWSYGEIMGDGLREGASPRRIMRYWMRRPIHSQAILHRRFTSMGVGSAFGRPRGSRSKRSKRTYVMTFAG